jgi:hypothetical protein
MTLGELLARWLDHVDEQLSPTTEREYRRLVTRIDHGLVLHFPSRPDLAADVRRFAIDEKRCCQFWGFAIESTDYELTLRWDAPPDARELLATIAAYLEGDEPVTAISGLL